MKGSWQSVESASDWEEFLTSNPKFGTSLLTQSYSWGRCFENLNQVIIRRIYSQDNKEIAGYSAVVEVAKFYRFLTILGGPLIDWNNHQLLAVIQADLMSIAKQQKCHFVRMRPSVSATAEIVANLKAQGFKQSPINLSVEKTGLLDLKLSDEQLSSNMSQSLRRKIRKAQADKLIQIKVSTAQEDVLNFAQLHAEHAQLQNYKPFSRRRIIEQFNSFAQEGQALIYSSFREGELLAANMMFFHGQEANYYFGISTEAGKKYPSAPLLHLEAIKEAKKRQIPLYNLWGIVGKDETGNRYFGFSQFKRSFGIIEQAYVPAHDLVVSKFRYIFIYIFETLRKKHRRL